MFKMRKIAFSTFFWLYFSLPWTAASPRGQCAGELDREEEEAGAVSSVCSVWTKRQTGKLVGQLRLLRQLKLMGQFKLVGWFKLVQQFKLVGQFKIVDNSSLSFGTIQTYGTIQPCWMLSSRDNLSLWDDSSLLDNSCLWNNSSLLHDSSLWDNSHICTCTCTHTEIPVSKCCNFPKLDFLWKYH